MGLILIPDDLERLIEQRVADGLAASPAAFLRDAVARLMDDESAERELAAVVAAGEADLAADRVATIATIEDEAALGARLDELLQAKRDARSR